MTKDEALRLALEALRKARRKILTTEECHATITAIKEALETKDEPVAWMYEFYADRGYFGLDFEPQSSAYNTPLYTTPQQRTWVGLTDEEIEQVYMDTINFQQNARALEAKLKERNT